MPWDSAELIDVRKQGGTVGVAVKYSDGKEELIEEYQVGAKVDPNWLEMRAKLRLAQLNDTYAYADSLVLGPIDLSKVVDPTPEELAARAYFENAQKVEAVKDAISKDLLASSQKIADLAAATKAAGKAEYYGIK